MKTLKLTIAILLVSVIGFSQTTFAATKINEQVSTTLTNVTAINKIEVHGNVELYLSAGSADQVKVYNKYYAESAMVQDENGTLRISSYTAKKLIVWVTASDLRNLSVYDNAEVKSFGKLSAIDLDVKLYNKASAQLNMDIYNANVTLKDSATADLSGSVENGSLDIAQASSINTTNLAAMHLTKKAKIVMADKNEAPELASM